MKRLLSSLTLAAAVLAATMCAQSSSQPSPFPPVPTTKILAVGRITGAMSADNRKTVMPKEVSATVRLYLSGKLDQWYVRTDRNGVVFLLNVSTVEEARSLLEALPLGKAKLMEFEFVPLGPLSPLHILLEQNHSASATQSKSTEQ